MSNDKPVRLLTADEVAEWLSTSPDYLKKMRYQQVGPPYIKMGRAVRYHPAQVSRWLRARQHGLPEPVQVGRTQ